MPLPGSAGGCLDRSLDAPRARAVGALTLGPSERNDEKVAVALRVVVAAVAGSVAAPTPALAFVDRIVRGQA